MELRTDSWIAGVVDPLQAPAAGVPAAPLVSSVLQPGAAATRGTEAVAAVPGQHRASLSHNSCRTERRDVRIFNQTWEESYELNCFSGERRCFLLTGLFLAELQQVSVGRLREAAALLSAAFKEFGSVLVGVDGKPGGRLLDTVRCLRGGRGGLLPLLHSQEDEHSGRFLEKVFHCLVSEPTQLNLSLLRVRMTSVRKLLQSLM